MTEIGVLAGFTVAVTAERRREELAALLRRRGARVVTASAITIVPLAHDDALRAATERRKWYASITFRSSYPMAIPDPGWNAPYSPRPGPI